jgi:predicted nuclease with RNAse H fold
MIVFKISILIKFRCSLEKYKIPPIRREAETIFKKSEISLLPPKGPSFLLSRNSNRIKENMLDIDVAKASPR